MCRHRERRWVCAALSRACVLFCWREQPGRAGEALTLLSFSLPGLREIPLFVYIEPCRPVALPGSPAYCCNIEAAGDPHSKQDLETRITLAPRLLSVCVWGERVWGRFLLRFLQFCCDFWPFRSVCLCEFYVCAKWKIANETNAVSCFLASVWTRALQLATLRGVLSSSHSQCHKQPQPLAGVALRCTDTPFLMNTRPNTHPRGSSQVILGGLSQHLTIEMHRHAHADSCLRRFTRS